MGNQIIRLDNESYFALVKQRLDIGDEVRILVIGKSMRPFLQERDDILLRPSNEKDVRIGDVVLARWKNGYVLHRVVRRKKGELWLAGDNNLVQIEKVASTDVMAILVEAKREGKILSVAQPFHKCLGMLWYYLRFPRRVVVWMKRRVLKKIK